MVSLVAKLYIKKQKSQSFLLKNKNDKIKKIREKFFSNFFYLNSHQTFFTEAIIFSITSDFTWSSRVHSIDWIKIL